MNPDAESAKAFADGWFHTGDIGHVDDSGQLMIRGRKKEMIVTPEGLNVFPEDIERIINSQPGVLDSAVVGEDRVHAVFSLAGGTDPDSIVRAVNTKLEDHQRFEAFRLAFRRVSAAERTRNSSGELFQWYRRAASVTFCQNRRRF
ncbi:MAG: hypothetical protein WKF37_18225 [Bryobacteraceae bacterium]